MLDTLVMSRLDSRCPIRKMAARGDAAPASRHFAHAQVKAPLAVPIAWGLTPETRKFSILLTAQSTGSDETDDDLYVSCVTQVHSWVAKLGVVRVGW